MMRHRIRAALALVLAGGVAAMLAAAGEAAGLFSDIAGSPDQEAIVKLGVTGILPGYPDGTFKPDQPITRLQVVEALAKGLDVKGAGAIPNYKDLNEIPEDVRPAIAALLNTGAATQQKAEVKKGDIAYALATDKAVYGIDDPVDLTFTVTNTGTQDAKFEFATDQQYDFVITDGNTEIARYSLGRTFVAGGLTLVLAAGKSFTYQTRWLQKNQDNRIVPPGTYTITAISTTKDAPVSVSLTFQKGLLSSFPDNTFRPNAQVSRAEFAALLVRAMGLQGEATREAHASLSAKDAADVPGPLHGYVAVAIARKLMPPFPDGTWRPAAPVTRGEAAGALVAVMDALGKFNYVKGTLVKITAQDITVSSSVKSVTSYALTPTVAVYKNNKAAAPGDLKPNDRVLLLLTGPQGRAGYIEATGP